MLFTTLLMFQKNNRFRSKGNNCGCSKNKSVCNNWECCYFNTKSSIDYDCVIGDYSYNALGSILCLNVTIGNNSFVEAGSVLINDILDNMRVAGCPAKLLKSKHE
jgi:acetyltransferase-like isoleucine patch superfamily enzyme